MYYDDTLVVHIHIQTEISKINVHSFHNES